MRGENGLPGRGCNVGGDIVGDFAKETVNVKGLGQKMVGAASPQLLVPHRRRGHNRDGKIGRARIIVQCPAGAQAIQAWQVDIHQDKRQLCRARKSDGCCPIGGGSHGVAGVGEHHRDEVAYGVVVINHQYCWGTAFLGHKCPSTSLISSGHAGVIVPAAGPVLARDDLLAAYMYARCVPEAK
jgi:hypothetical protein